MPQVPANITEIGYVHVSSILTDTGTHTAFSLSDIGAEEAIGRLTVVIDRLRESVAYSWDADSDEAEELDIECPNCGFSLFDPEDNDD